MGEKGAVSGAPSRPQQYRVLEGRRIAKWGQVELGFGRDIMIEEESVGFNDVTKVEVLEDSLAEGDEWDGRF